MSGSHISDRRGFPAYLSFVCCAFLMMLTVGCGDESAGALPADNITTDAADTGAVTLSIQWRRASAAPYSDNTLTTQAIEDCGTAGVALITAEVYDASNTPIAGGGPWSCSEREGRIERIPAGPSRKIAVLGWDTPRERILYQGHTPSGVDITPGETTDAGTIVAYAFIPSGLAATADSNNRIRLAWNDLDEAMGVGGYRIYRDGQAMATSDGPSYEDRNLRPGFRYCYTVAAYDIFDNESGESEARCATTEPSVDDADDDGDGYSELQGDCDDANADVNPGATEICNGIDDNCSGDVDEGLSRTTTCGVGACAGNTGTATCSAGQWADDTCDPMAGSGPERCDNEDNDCDGAVDEGLSRPTVCGVGACAGNTGQETCSAGDWTGDTCNPMAGSGPEVCDGEDNDCDGAVDEGVQNTYYLDSDGDGFGVADNPILACAAPEDYVDNRGDCRDDLPSVNPEAAEVCGDGIDNNCNDETDENCAIDVNIDSDFEFMDQGFPMGLSVGETAAGALRESPYEELTEPSYYDLYGEFFSTDYGYLRMGNSRDNTVSFVIVEIQGWGDNPNSYRLFIDSNNNEDLTDDDGPYSNQGTGRLGVLVSLDAAVIDDAGTTITRPYNLWMWLDDNFAVRFYAQCHYRGEIRIGGETYTAVAFERRNHDALYRESGLYIDLDRNDRLDEERENFMDQTMVGVDGRQYELLLNYP